MACLFLLHPYLISRSEINKRTQIWKSISMLVKSIGIMINLWNIVTVLIVVTVLVLLVIYKIMRGCSKNIFLNINILPFLFAMMFYFFIVAIQKQRLMTMLTLLKIEHIKWSRKSAISISMTQSTNCKVSSGS